MRTEPPTGPRASVVIPAHDEAGVVERCLDALLADAEPGEFEVVVVANGCRDDTAVRAKAAASRFPCEAIVLDLAVASKAAALRAGDGAASAYPRLYVDADVVCPTSTARALVTALQDPAVELAVPERVLDLTRTSRPAATYLRAWEVLPWVRVQPSGRGVYALAGPGRRRLGAFPDVVADDYWVTTRFPETATRVVSSAPVTVSPAPSVRALLAARTRMFAGNLQLGSVPYPPPARERRRAYLLSRAIHPSAWPGLLMYVGITFFAKSRARTAVRSGVIGWSQPTSERQARL